MVTGEWRGEAGARVYSGIALVVEDQRAQRRVWLLQVV